MTGTCVNLADLSTQEAADFRGRYDTFFFDMDGTLAHLNRDPIPGADIAVARLVELGKEVYLVTDSCLYTRKSLSDRLRSRFPNFTQERIITAPYVIAEHLKKIGFNKKMYVMGEVDGIVQELKDAGFNVISDDEVKKLVIGTVTSLPLEENVGAVILGADLNFSYEKLYKAVNYLKKPSTDFYISADFLSVNADPILPGPGALALPITKLTKKDGIICSKASMSGAKYIQSLGSDMKRCLFVGDGLPNDIFCGNNCGMDTLLVMGGFTSKEDLDTELAKGRPMYVPKYIGDTVADLGALYS